MSQRLKIWFHGTTDRRVANLILKEGFQPFTYFAAHLEDAVEFGGPWVFEVALPWDEQDKGWQHMCADGIPPSQIVSLTVYTRKKKLERKDVRTAVFNSNVENAF